jgi:hypothetical protein
MPLGGAAPYHLSGFGRDRPDAPPGNDRVADYVRRQVAAGRVATGEIRLEPHWDVDYVALVRDYLRGGELAG